ncbi:LemA family protein [Dissulfurirhabdus thermomarina]|uniref:LemA family protein n=1 Tax=Dissulfurirhabdus thermomarina TaxID=1765737 RepID=A0A6N9TSL4_DISTH|nr:LemA family protein [Dissulfurirhabdus thermomarina]NDY42437.1 LemA family protein [Dissulfurirhabdus thermomarina]NMX24082.1 LemA family protein [Dissulfurirhabdus thermomarina]
MIDYVFLGLLLLALAYPVAVYNRLVALRNRFRNAFAQIDVQLERRYDLIPNLVETAKAYMKHERETLEAVIQARDRAAAAGRAASRRPEDAAAVRSLMGADSALTASLGRLFAVAENYPDLKANQTMGQLMEELSSTENKVAFARQAFNDAVMTYNTYLEQFPHNVVGGSAGFRPAQPFEVEEREVRRPVRVAFD